MNSAYDRKATAQRSVGNTIRLLGHQVQQITVTSNAAYSRTPTTLVARVEELGIQIGTAHFLERIQGDMFEATMEPSTLTHEPSAEEYSGELSVVAIDASGRRTVANQTVAVTTAS